MTTSAPSRLPRPGARPALRRRLDNQILRWQARLDARWADRVVPWVGAAVLSILYLSLALARARTLDAGTSLASYAQGAWLIARGEPAELTISGSHLLANHAPLGVYPLGWITRVLPTAPTLLCAQSAALAVGVVPLWRLARQVASLRVGAAMALCVSYGAFPLLNNLNLADFHPESLAVGPLLMATLFGLTKRWKPFALACVLTVVWSAELGLVVAGLGALLVIEGHRRQGGRAIVAGVVWTAVAILIIEGSYGDESLVEPGAFLDYGEGVVGVVRGMVTNPLTVLGDLFAEENMEVLVLVLAPLLFLPVLAPRYLLPAIPLQSLYFIADVPVQGEQGLQYTVPAIAFCFVASTFALSRIGRRSIERVLVDRRVLVVLVAAAVAFFAVYAENSPYNEPWNWGRRDVVDDAREQAADVVGEEISVRASPSVLPLLAERDQVYELPDDEALDIETALADGVMAVVIDDRDLPDLSLSERLDFAERMVDEDYDLVYRAQGVSVYRHSEKRVDARPR